MAAVTASPARQAEYAPAAQPSATITDPNFSHAFCAWMEATVMTLPDLAALTSW
jgi:hypothetical protein